MPKIPLYEETKIVPRATPNMVDETQLHSTYSDIAEGTAQIAATMERQRQADEATAVNEAVISGERRKIEGINELRSQWLNEPEGYNKAAAKYYDSLDEQIAADLPSGRAKEAYKRTAGLKNNDLLQSDLTWENNRRVEIYGQRVENAANDLNVIAYTRGKAGQDIGDLLNSADASTIAGASFVARDKLDGMNRKMRSGVVNYALNGMMESNPYQAKKLLDSGKFQADLDAHDLMVLNNRADAEIKQREAAARQQQTLGRVEAKLMLGDLHDRLTAGFFPPLTELDAVRTKIMEAGDPAQAKQYDQLVQHAAFVSEASRLTPAQLDSTIHKLEAEANKDGATEAEFTKLKLAKDVRGKMEAGMADPKEWAAGLGLIELKPIVNEAGQFDPALLRQRVAQAEDLSRTYSRDTPILTNAEADSFAAMADEKKPAEAVQFLAGFANTKDLSATAATKIAQQIAPKSPVMAAAMATVGNNPMTAFKILNGNKLDTKLPKGAEAQIQMELGNAVQDPDALKRISSAVLAVYRHNAFAQRLDPSTLVDAKDIRNAIAEVMGPIITVNKKSSIVSWRNAGRWQTQDDFDDMVDDAKSMGWDVLRDAMGTLPSQWKQDMQRRNTVGDMLKDNEWVAMDAGKYALRRPDGSYFTNSEGKKYLIDAPALQAAIGRKKNGNR